MTFLALAMMIPLCGIIYAGFTAWLKYRQHQRSLEILRVYAERGETPPDHVLNALTKGFSLSEPGMNAPAYPSSTELQGPVRYWSLVGLFGVLSAGFGVAYVYGGPGAFPFGIVALCMGAVAVWSLVIAVALGLKR